jgi:hypothetical protein
MWHNLKTLRLRDFARLIRFALKKPLRISVKQPHKIEPV